MKDSALSVANYFVRKSLDEGKELKPLKLMKLVYIAHGFMLALMDRSVLNKEFDKVEAWKLGPVIPSVYYSFKIYKNSAITQETFVVRVSGSKLDFETPKLNDEDAKKVCDIVWKRYDKHTDSDLVSILHRPGTPWAFCYRAGENKPIPDELTKMYYKKLVERLLSEIRNG